MKIKTTRMILGSLGCLAILLGMLVIGTPKAAQADTGSNWQGQYWNNNNFTGNPTITRTDNAINFNWGAGSPDPAIPADNFSARWTNTINFSAGTYSFRAGAEDGIRVYIDNVVVIDRLTASSTFQVNNASATLGAGAHSLRVDYVAFTGAAGVLFDWTQTNTAAGPTPVPGASTSPNPGVKPLKAVVIATIANVRSGPGTDFTPLAEIHKDEVYNVFATDAAGWFEIQLSDGRMGWVWHRVIYLYNGDPATLPITNAAIKPPSPLVDVQGVARVTIIVRDGPSRINSQKIGAINQGQYFKVLQLSRTRAWIQVNADGLIGWVYLPNVDIVSGELGRLPISSLPR